MIRPPEFWSHEGFLPRLLSPLAALVVGGSRMVRLFKVPHRTSVPVICIGNATVGGAGKTPTVLTVVEHLTRTGERPHILTRGYGGRERGPIRVDPMRHDAAAVGDEPLLLARSAPTWVGGNRRATSAAAEAAGATCLVMDDGFQNPSLNKDLSFLVVDAGFGFGNGRVMPAGPLREPPGVALGRADAVVLVGDGDRGDDHPLARWPGPVLRAKLVAAREAADRLRGHRVAAFAGIARPQKLVETLHAIGCEVTVTHFFPDHHPYRAEEVMAIVAAATAAEAVPVTTEKDAVRLPANARRMVEVLPVSLVVENMPLLDRLLRTGLARGRAAIGD